MMDGNSSDDLAVQVLRKMQNGTGFATVTIPEGITLQEPSDAALARRSASILTSAFVPSSLGQTALSAEGIIIGTANGLDSFTQLLAAADTTDMGHCSSASMVADLSPILGTPISVDGTGMAAHSLHPVLATSVNSLDSMQIIDDLRPADPLPLSGSEAMTITVHCTMLDAVFVVGQQNWQCCMCRELYGFDVSIDQHLAQKHKRPLGRSFSAPEDVKVPSTGLGNSIIFPQADLKEIVSTEPFQTIAEQTLASLNLPDGQGSAARTGLEKEVALLMAQTFTHSDRMDKGTIVKEKNDDHPADLSNMYNSMSSASKANGLALAKMIATVEKAMLYANDIDTRKDLQLVASELVKMQKEASHKDWLRKNSRYTKCPECNKQVRNNRYLIKQHNRSHEKTKKYRCRVCNKMFKYMHTLRRHISQKNHFGGLSLEEDVDNAACDAIASTIGELNTNSLDYIMKANGSDDVFKPLPLANDSRLTSSSTHSNVQPEDKNVCENAKTIILDSGTPAYEKILATLLSKGENNRNSRGNKLSLVQCFVCDREIRNRNYYISRHARTHLEALCFTCRFCQLEFYRSDHYQCHMNSHKNHADFEKHTIAEAHDHKQQTASFSKEMEKWEIKNLLKPSTVSCKVCGKGILNRTYNIKRHAEMHSFMEWDCILASPRGHKIPKPLASSHPIQCRACDMTFKSYSLKRRHMLKHRSSFQCNHCSSRFETGLGFHAHIQTCTKTLRKIKSQSAGNVAETLKQNQESSGKVVDGTKFVCSVCNASIINTTQSINRHMRELHSEGQPHVCSVCSRVFNTYQKLQRHFKSHGDKGGICDVCGKVFLSKTALRSHTKLHGSAEGMFQCPKCPKSFRFQGRLDKHLLKHAERADLCPHCGKVYISKIHLQRHISVEHLGVKDYRYKCKCGAQFFESVQLRDHIAYRHKGIKLYTCRFCKKSFNCRPTMIRHERKEHTNDLPYKCQHCLQGFPEKSKLVSHEMTHTGMSPHKCDVCGKYFTTGSALKAHKNLHLGVKPFVCAFCPKTYLKNWHLQQHLRKSHCKIVDIPDAPLGQQGIAESFMIFDPNCQEVILQNAGKQGTCTASPTLAQTS